MKKLSKILLAISFVLSLTTSAFATTVTAVSWGGAYTESQKLGYGDPTGKALGITINVLINKLIFASLFFKIGISGASSSVLPIL